MAHGDLSAALGLCQEAVGLAEEAADKFENALAQQVLAEVTSRLEPTDPGRAERAIRILQEIGARPEVARSYGSFARMLEAEGQRERATEYLVRAINMFQDMDMTWDLAQAEQTLR